MDLSHWDLVDRFSLDEVASLAAGVDPKAVEFPPDVAPKRELLMLVVSNAYQRAIYEARDFLEGWFFDDNMSEAFKKINSIIGGLTSVELFNEVSELMDVGGQLPEKFLTGSVPVTFDRKTLSKWFKAKGYKPAYSWLRQSDQASIEESYALPSTPVVLGNSNSEVNSRKERTYQNIIGGLLELLLGRTPSNQPQSVFQNQAAIINALLAHFEKIPGISKRTLEDRFAAARRNLTAP